MAKKKFLGFSGSEIGVIILTVGLIAALSVWNIGRSYKLQRDLKRKADLGMVETALYAYFEIHQKFPESNGDQKILACGPSGGDVCQWGFAWQEGQYIYITPLPQEELIGEDWSDYAYRYDKDEQKFWLWAFLERSDDTDLPLSHQVCPGNWQRNQYVVCGPR